MKAYARARAPAPAVLLRGSARLRRDHHLHTDRLLTLSEDLPAVAIAVDAPAPISAAAEEAAARSGGGLITLERAVTGDAATRRQVAEVEAHRRTLGRGARAGGAPAHVALVDALRAPRRGRRERPARRRRHRPRAPPRGAVRRARTGTCRCWWSPSAPATDRAGARRARRGAAASPPRTLERVRVCKRDGAAARRARDELRRAAGLKLTVVCGRAVARTPAARSPSALVRGLRAGGAAGATALRGIWGYHGEHAPHGDGCCQLRRRVPVLVTTSSTPRAHPPRAFALDRPRSRRPTASSTPSACPRSRLGSGRHARRAGAGAAQGAGSRRSSSSRTDCRDVVERAVEIALHRGSTCVVELLVELVAERRSACRPTPPSTSAVWTSSSDEQRRPQRAGGSRRRTTGSGASPV